MKFFVDSAEIDQISKLNALALVDGVTTNPSLIAKSGRQMITVIEEICDLVKGPVSAEVTATNYNDMLKEGIRLSKIAQNVVIKVPLTPDGLQTCLTLSNKDIAVNVTLCFSSAQALLAAKCGATFISPFVGRLDDTGQNGMDLIKDIKTIYDHYNFPTQILVASVRTVEHVQEAAKIGAHVATLPPKILDAMFEHSLTEKGLKQFLDDWSKTNQSIL